MRAAPTPRWAPLTPGGGGLARPGHSGFPGTSFCAGGAGLEGAAGVEVVGLRSMATMRLPAGPTAFTGSLPFARGSMSGVASFPWRTSVEHGRLDLTGTGPGDRGRYVLMIMMKGALSK